jgi:uncharacterized repeat protein (TIGR01451 family)
VIDVNFSFFINFFNFNDILSNMKFKYHFFFLCITLSLGAKSQSYVTIPDVNFKNWLTSYYPTCMSGNQLDITCPAVQNLMIMNVENTFISNLTGIEYFVNLQTLNANYSLLNSIPVLPSSLKNLNCRGVQLSSISNLPNTLRTLDCIGNQITSLPLLPDSLKTLYCGLNQLTSLPILPGTLQTLDCASNNITSLPFLPPTLQTLGCQYNQLTVLPTLPNALKLLKCSHNGLISLPVLSSQLIELECQANSLSSLPVLPQTLRTLNCFDNQLTNLPSFPNNFKALYCGNNQISCFPVFPSSMTGTSSACVLTGNLFTCLPNYVPTMDSATMSYPLCSNGDLINNFNGCPSAKGIVGNVYKDNNNNCIMDAGDQSIPNVHLELYDASNNFLAQTYSFTNGMFYFFDTVGTYTIKLDTTNVPYVVQCPTPGIDSTVTLTPALPLAKINFDVVCKPGFDLGVKSVLRDGLIFPGQQHRLRVLAGDLSNSLNLNCVSGIGGQVQISVSGPVTFDSIATGGLSPLIAGTVFTYNIADFGTVNMNSDFGLFFTTDTTATAGDTICVSVNVSPIQGDNNTSNNNYQFCYNVLNSLDPNIKEVYPLNVIPGYQDWFTYTIHFQNTGNAPAINILLTDTLDNNLDLENFELINFSHYNTVSMTGNKLNFHFPNIQLPDSTSNPEGSKGFVQYRIKSKPGLPSGTLIKNTAYIYFDYNPAIVTNTTINSFDQPLLIKEDEKNYNECLSESGWGGILRESF